jgi:hypothetical protein
MKCLHNVTYGCTFVTYGASQRCRKSRASQSCARFAAAIRGVAGRSRQNGSRPLCVSTPSLSISSAGKSIKTGRSDYGREGRVHGKTFRSVGRTTALIRQHQKLIVERRCNSGLGGYSPAEQEAWVNGHQVGATRFSWNIDLIVCCRQSWNRFMTCWYPTNDGPSRRRRLRRS